MSVDFFDSNIFIYLFDDTAPTKTQVAAQLIDKALELDNGCISFQVVQETLRVITGKLPKPAKLDLAQEFLQDTLLPMWRVMPSHALYVHSLQLQDRWKFSFYDSLIVAAALEAGCKRLLSEDLEHGQRIEGLRIENPFKP
jgi:predicted nucleic acid-binding protein